MLFLVEMDHLKSLAPPTPEAGKDSVERIIFPTLERAEQLISEKKILAGGPVVGSVALRFIVESDSTEDLDSLLTSLPLWTVAETRVTSLITFSERRDHVQSLLAKLEARAKS